MTLHAAKGLEFETVFLPGWEEGLFPHQRALDEGGRSGLEEERRLAYVGLTRAKRHCHIWFVSNRRIHGLWQSTVPSRFLDELPAAHCDVAEPSSNYGGYGSYGASRFDNADAFSSNRSSPGWQRAQQNRSRHSRRTGARAPASAVERIGYGETDSGYGAGRKSVKRPRHRGRTRRQVRLRHPVGLHGRRPRLPHEIRQRQHRLHRRQQAHRRFRQGRAEARAGRVCGAGVSTAAIF
jgi:ATP-dependent exoDNAse (exonuclease V) beta subunit